MPANGEVQGYLAQSFDSGADAGGVQAAPERGVADTAPLNKRQIDAEDVVFSWEKFAAKSTSRKDLAKLADNPGGPVESVKAIDKTTVEFKLAYPYAPFLSAMAYSRYLQIMPRESEAGGYDPRNEMRSGGPWILQNYQRNVIFQYRKNPDYWDADNSTWTASTSRSSRCMRRGWRSSVRRRCGASRCGREDVIATKKDVPDLASMQRLSVARAG